MKKVLATIAMLAIPGMAMAVGLIGDCYDCHTMHNSEQGVAVATNDDGTNSAVPNLLKLDCMACHANNPTGGTEAIMTLSGGSQVPQVAHNAATDLAGGNFSYGINIGNATVDKVHNAKELFASNPETYSNPAGAPPGMYNGDTTHAGIFTVGANLYDDFSCAGANGCHGTRNQEMVTGNATTAERVGMSAIAGAHHVSYDGIKDGALPDASHSGQNVANGYRFIPGLKGAGNTDVGNRWQNVSTTSHNEYYGDPSGFTAPGCTTCHAGGIGSTTTTYMAVPNQSMSGFCTTCHGNFHSSGTGSDLVDNGSSTAFLRHPSDYVLASGSGSAEYAAYTAYNLSAPVARPDLTTIAAADTVNPATDMVMCLSCHQAHGSAYDYILRFDYTTMTAGQYADKAATDAIGGCLACHTEKGVAK